MQKHKIYHDMPLYYYKCPGRATKAILLVIICYKKNQHVNNFYIGQMPKIYEKLIHIFIHTIQENCFKKVFNKLKKIKHKIYVA